jgi:RNA polymerase sigma-70 factor (ECF subfamily)
MIERARHGDRAAQAALLRELQDPLYRLCLSLLDRDPELARDATQETALRILRLLPSFRGEARLRTWAMGIAINVCREMRRGQRPLRVVVEQATSDAREIIGPDRAAEASEQAMMLRQVLAELPDRQREAIVLRFFEELSVEQTASAMDCATGTVKATVFQALRALRSKLGSLSLLLV